MTIEKLKLHNHIACSHQTSQDGDIPQRSPTQNLHMTSYILYLPFQNAYGHKTRQGADFKRKASTLWPVDNMNNLKSSDKSKKLYFYLERFETQRLSRHWLFANFEIVFYFAANLSSCFNDGGAAFYYERFYTFQWVLTQRNCPLKWFWDNPLNKWLSVCLSTYFNAMKSKFSNTYNTIWSLPMIENIFTKNVGYYKPFHHPPRPTATHYNQKNTHHQSPPTKTNPLLPKKYPEPPITTQKIPTTTHHHPKYAHHHPTPHKKYPPPPITTHNKIPPPAKTHHSPKYIRYHSPPPPITQEKTTITYHHPKYILYHP